MDEKPPRRWFRFRLSTVLILTAILAWAMATRPRIGIVILQFRRVASERSFDFSAGYIPDLVDKEFWMIRLYSFTPSEDRGCFVYFGPNPELAWPTLALAVFISWKVMWAFRERVVRRHMSAAPEQNTKDERLRRRWSRIGLPTILILAAITVWGMTTRPNIGIHYFEDKSYRFSAGYVPDNDKPYIEMQLYSFITRVDHRSTPRPHDRSFSICISPSSALAWPALALAAFLAWKTAWAVVEHRRRQNATPE